MSAARRKALLALAGRYHVPILEDDPYGMIYYGERPDPPLACDDRTGTVIYLSTASKVLCSGLRLGWMVAPPDLVRLVTAAKQMVDLHNNNLVQRMVDVYLRRGLLAGHLERVRGQYKAKRDAMIAALEKHAPRGVSWTSPGGGFYVWVTLPDNVFATKLLREAVERKVSFVAGPAFFCNGRGENRLRLNFTFSSPEMIQQGVKTICRLIRDAGARGGDRKVYSGEEILPVV